MNRCLLCQSRIGLVALTATALMAVAALFIAANAASGAPSRTKATTNVAYLSFAVANSYDAPMLAAAKKVASKGGAKVTVFDAANDYKKQLQQLQTAIASKQYQAIVVQPIYGLPLLPDMFKKAIKSGIKVVNIDQILGTNPATAAPPVPGMSGNVVFVQTQIGQKQGKLLVAACAKIQASPCNVGYLYSVKITSLDTAIRNGVNAATGQREAAAGLIGLNDKKSVYPPGRRLAQKKSLPSSKALRPTVFDKAAIITGEQRLYASGAGPSSTSAHQ